MNLPLQSDRAHILLPRPFNHGFDYRIPDAMTLRVGDYVSVPFGSQQLVGVVWGEGEQDVADAKCKEVLAVHRHVPPMPEALRKLIDWTSAYQLAPKGMVLKMALPVLDAIVNPPSETVYRLGDVSGDKLSVAREKVIAALREELELSRKVLKEVASDSVIRAMVQADMLRADERVVEPVAPHFEVQHGPTLSAEQIVASQQLVQQLDAGFAVTVLDGVTGSGKTEVYFEMIAAMLKKPTGQMVVMLPEIGLSMQWKQRFTQRFGVEPVLWHSHITPAQRRDAWLAIASGATRVVVGARSALYLPYADLRGIIVDEEHDAAYRQEDGVLYHARDMAVLRGKLERVPVLLASATPSVETVCNIEAGKYAALHLKERHGAFDYPDVSLIDVRNEPPESGAWIAPLLQRKITETLAQGHQALLFLNRRGYAPLVLCRCCGHRFECPNCSAWMVQHNYPPRLECHHCGMRMPMPKACPECATEDQLVACGPGVERLAEEVEASFPDARVAVMTGDDGDLSDKIAAVLERQVDVIIGTQLIAKGHHFPYLALVGVVDADLGLDGGDLRAGERTYQLLHQLAGRAGREAAEGKVYLQTAQPDHPVMQALASGDRDGFMALEMAQRKVAQWPPFGRLAALLIDGKNEREVAQISRQIVQAAPNYQGVKLLGPAPAPLSKLRNQYRYRILIKTAREVDIQALLREWTARLKLPRTVRLKVDVDPYNFL